jgi:hypothetical protein
MVEMPVVVASSVLSPSIKEVFTTVIRVLELGGTAVGQLQAFLRERDGKLVGRKARAAVLLDAKVAEGRPVDHLMPENDHAIDHELQEVVVLVYLEPADLLRDDAGQPTVQKQVAEAIDFSTLRHRVIEEIQQHVDPVEDDALGMDLVHFGLKDMQHAQQVEFPCLHGVRREACIEEEELLLFQRGKIPSEGGCVGDDLARALLEGDEHARLLRPFRAVDQRLKREDSLAAARSTHHQGRSPARQSPVSDFVEPLDPGEHFCQRSVRLVFHSVSFECCRLAIDQRLRCKDHDRDAGVGASPLLA